MGVLAFWAPVVMSLLGGPRSAGILHRIGAIGIKASTLITIGLFLNYIPH